MKARSRASSGCARRAGWPFRTSLTRSRRPFAKATSRTGSRACTRLTRPAACGSTSSRTASWEDFAALLRRLVPSDGYYARRLGAAHREHLRGGHGARQRPRPPCRCSSEAPASRYRSGTASSASAPGSACSSSSSTASATAAGSSRSSRLAGSTSRSNSRQAISSNSKTQKSRPMTGTPTLKTGMPSIRAGKGAAVAVAVEDEVGPVIGDRLRQALAAEKGQDRLGLALDRRFRRRIVEDDAD